MLTILVIILLIAHSILFFLTLKIGKQRYPNSPKLQRLGKKVLATKEQQLRTNKLLVLFDQKIKEDSTVQPTIILSLLILLKSIGMLLLGMVGLSLIVIPIQGLLMAALVEQSKEKPELSEGFHKAILPQFITQLHLTVIGNLIGITLLTDFYTDQINALLNSSILWISLLIPLIASWLTARIEVDFYKNNRDLVRG